VSICLLAGRSLTLGLLAALLVACTRAPAATPPPSPTPTTSPSASPSASPSGSPSGVVVTFRVVDEEYRILITDAEPIAHSRALLAGSVEDGTLAGDRYCPWSAEVIDIQPAD
jgi:hypothetical protein